MKTKNLILSLSVAAFGLFGCNNNGVSTKTTATLKTGADTASYYLGFTSGQSLAQMQKQLKFKVNNEALFAGINAGITNKKAPADPMQMEAFLRTYFRKLQEQMALEAKKKGDEFLAANAKKEGIKVTDSGLQYKVITEGKGATPTDASMVKVHYKGTLLDGTEFDSSYKRNEPATFPVNGVIRGWSEALKLMPVGSKWILYIPSDLAYGPRGTYGIGPNEMLTFEVELLEIVDQNDTKKDSTKK